MAQQKKTRPSDLMIIFWTVYVGFGALVLLVALKSLWEWFFI